MDLQAEKFEGEGNKREFNVGKEQETRLLLEYKKCDISVIMQRIRSKSSPAFL